MKTVNALNFKEDDKIFYITTEKANYRANELNTVFILWFQAYDSGKDISQVIHVGSVG